MDTSYDSALFKDTRDHFSGEEEEEAADDPDPEELNPELVDPPAEPPAMDAPVDPVVALWQAIVDAFGQVGRNASYPMPTFSGKKGEKPDNHILWFTDYCNHYNIVLAQKSNEFVKTLTGKARAWADAVPHVGAPPHLPPLKEQLMWAQTQKKRDKPSDTNSLPGLPLRDEHLKPYMPNGKTSVSTPVKMTLKNSLMTCGNYLRSLRMVLEQP